MTNTTVKPKTEEYQAQERTVGFFGQLSLSYANQVYLTVVVMISFLPCHATTVASSIHLYHSAGFSQSFQH